MKGLDDEQIQKMLEHFSGSFNYLGKLIVDYISQHDEDERQKLRQLGIEAAKLLGKKICDYLKSTI